MPDKKCLYSARMESADSNASIANISKNRLSAVGAVYHHQKCTLRRVWTVRRKILCRWSCKATWIFDKYGKTAYAGNFGYWLF